MKGAAITRIPTKIFAIFAIMIGESPETAVMFTEPEQIEKSLPNRPGDIHILPWYGEKFTVDYTNRENLQSTVDNINKIIEQIEPCDPWVKQVFGIEGTAEGIVYVPVNNEIITRKQYSDLTFKAKGEKHKVVKTKQAVQIDPEVAKSVNEFVTLFVTEPRLEQGMNATGGKFDIKQVGAFLKWFCSDVFKESKDELEASNIKWEDAEKSVQHAARNWYIAKTKQL